MPTDFKSLIGVFLDLIATAMPVLGGIALLVFFWGLAKFIKNAGDVGKHQEGKDLMIWGVVALFIMVTLWGLIGFAQSSLGISNTRFGIPYLPSTGNAQSGYCTYQNGTVVSGYTQTQCSSDNGAWKPNN